MTNVLKKSLKVLLALMMCFSLVSLKSVDVSAKSKKLKVTSLKASCGSSSKVNKTITLTAKASGGTGTKYYQFWYKKGSTTKLIRNYSTSKKVSYKLTGVGTYKFIVKVKDSKGTVKQKTKSVKSTGFISTCSVSGSKYVNQALTITAGSQGGTGTKKYRIQVSFNGGGFITIKGYSTSRSVSYTPTQVGQYRFRVTTQDKKKKTATTTKTVSVVNVPTPVVPVSTVVTSAPGEVTVGTTYKLGLNIAAGDVITFSSSNPAACIGYWYKSGSTYSGYLMPIGEGWATITVTVNGNRSQSFNVYSHDNGNVKVGCDISIYQGNINIASLKSIGFDYVILRAGHGTGTDTNFVTNVRKCLSAQMPFGVYWYSTGDGASEADLLVSQLQAAGIAYNSQYFDFPIYYDLEGNASVGANAANITNAFVSRLNAYGIPTEKISVYANKSWLEGYLDNAYFTTYEGRIWFARYNIAGSMPSFYWDNNLHTVVGKMWQVGSGFENIPGLPSGCRLDMDYYYGTINLTGSGSVNVSNKNYDGNPATVTYSSSTNGNTALSVKYKVSDADDSTFTTTAPTAAGTYVVRVTFPATASFKEFYVEKTYTIYKISNTAKVDVLNGEDSILTDGFNYNDSTHLEVKTTDLKEDADIKVEYKLSTADTYTELEKDANDQYMLPVLNAGEYQLKVTYTATTNYKETIVNKTFKVNKVAGSGLDSIVNSAKPAANALTADGSDQALVTASTNPLDDKVDHIEYNVTTTNNQPSETDTHWSEEIPTGKDAGTYYVWYRVVFKNYNTITYTSSISVEIH